MSELLTGGGSLSGLISTDLLVKKGGSFADREPVIAGLQIASLSAVNTHRFSNCSRFLLVEEFISTITHRPRPASPTVSMRATLNLLDTAISVVVRHIG